MQFFVGVIDLRAGKFRGVDGEGSLPDHFRLTTGGQGADQGAAGQIFQVDAATVAAGDQMHRFDQGMENVVQALLAETVDARGQKIQLGTDEGIHAASAY